MFSKVLIANRGEISLRIIRTCKEMGIATVAVHTTVDQDAMHVRMADEAICIGTPRSPGNKESYLSFSAIISACEITGSNALHPGYGFLSENAEFVEQLEDHEITFIGPSSKHIKLMGDKITAKEKMLELGVPCVPGPNESIETVDRALSVASDIGYPVIVKASAGGGGRGMKVVNSQADMEAAYLAAQQEAGASFGNDEVYLEKFLPHGRHIEIQVLGDGMGNAVHFGERDCTIQRRHQKLLEEAPSPLLDGKKRSHIGEICAEAIAEMGYEGVGTIEFLYQDGEFYFIEMNTRLQVEHPVTEAIFGIDLVKQQINVAAGNPLELKQGDLVPRGHSIEVRINAETVPDFIPCPGKVGLYHSPGGLGIRMDSFLYNGYTVPQNYDSLIGKLISHGETRTIAIAKLKRALEELIVHPISTTAPLFQLLLEDRDFLDSNYDIHWLEKWIQQNGKLLKNQ